MAKWPSERGVMTGSLVLESRSSNNVIVLASGVGS